MTLSASDYPLTLQLCAWHERILEALRGHGLMAPAYPATLTGRPRGAAAARAYPIQGVLKYHGLWDWSLRTAYLPSISVNNDAAYSLTLVEFDPALAEDVVIIGSETAAGRPRERVVATLDAVRRAAHSASSARVVSHNRVRATRTGKGLGTSASASAALALAAVAAAFGPELVANTRFTSCMARLLAGSGCRSATGGASLWLSYPGITHEESYALRLDTRGELDEVALLTIPLDSRIGLATEQAHRDAPHSPFFESWLSGRGPEVLECMEAIWQGDWHTLGQLAELDSIRLHGVTMSGSRENKLFAWEPENITLFRLCNQLRSQGVPVYFSTDTGPTTVLITHRSLEERVAASVQAASPAFEVVRGHIAGPAEIVPLDEARHELGLVV